MRAGAERKSYKTMKRIYDKNDDFKTLGDFFEFCLTHLEMTAYELQLIYRRADKECKEAILEDLYKGSDPWIFHKFVKIFIFGHK